MALARPVVGVHRRNRSARRLVGCGRGRPMRRRTSHGRPGRGSGREHTSSCVGPSSWVCCRLVVPPDDRTRWRPSRPERASRSRGEPRFRMTGEQGEVRFGWGPSRCGGRSARACPLRSARTGREPQSPRVRTRPSRDAWTAGHPRGGTSWCPGLERFPHASQAHHVPAGLPRAHPPAGPLRSEPAQHALCATAAVPGSSEAREGTSVTPSRRREGSWFQAAPGTPTPQLVRRAGMFHVKHAALWRDLREVQTGMCFT